MSHKTPNQGGCWYCYQDEEKDALVFSMEWDAYVHPRCVWQRLADNPSDEEALIFAREILDILQEATDRENCPDMT